MTFRETTAQEGSMDTAELVPAAALGAAEEEPQQTVLAEDEADEIRPVPEEALTPLPAKGEDPVRLYLRKSARSRC
jgi:hypothetical protein